MKLKTLKDICKPQLGQPTSNAILKEFEEEIKAEAIKRVKAIIKEDNHDHEGINCAYCKSYLSDVNFILEFFNITEEDLQ